MLKHSKLLAFTLLGASLTCAGEWRHWRGPNFNGSTDETDLPTNWSQTENIAWSADLPGSSAATPIVCADRVFISGVDAGRKMLIAMCFNRSTGKLLWQRDIAEGISRDPRSTFAASSPVTDGKIVVFFYARGELACFNVDGTPRWERNLHDDYGEFAIQWTPASSPTLFDGKLFVQVLQRDVPARGHGMRDRVNESYILAADPATGKTLWRHIRPSKAVAESREAFTTPIPATIDGRRQLLVAGGDALSGHDLATGDEIWRWGTWNPTRIGHWRLVPSPVVAGNIVLACAPKNDPIYAVRVKGTGVYDDSSLAWVSRDVREVSSDVPTPAYYDGDFFVLSDLRKHLSRVEPQTGKVRWSIETPGRAKYEASPLAADGKIYIVDHSGEVAIVNAAAGAVIRQIQMDEPRGQKFVRASIAAAHGHLFIRTTSKLYCVGK